MLRIVSVAEMKMLEKSTLSRDAINEYELVVAAGSAVFRHFQKEVCPDRNKHLLILAGSGNNGADALVFAKCAALAGYPVTIPLFELETTQSASNKEALEDLKSTNACIINNPVIPDVIEDSDIIVDGLLGIGIDRPVAGCYREIINHVNQSDKRILAIDIPSGISGDTGLVAGVAIKADWTDVVGYLKTGNLLNDALDHSGVIRIVDLKLAEADFVPDRRLAGYDDIVPILATRKHKSHKYDYGNILVVGGSPGMMGAPQLAAMAALRSGAGIVKVAVRKQDVAFWTQMYPELMFAFFENPAELENLIMKADFCIVGVGIDRTVNPDCLEILRIILDSRKPVLVDAGGLDCLMELIVPGRTYDNVIVTPHPGELARMLNVSVRDLEAGCERFIGQLTGLGIVTLLKGHLTIVAEKGRAIYLRAGNPGMATAGMGDLLAGMIAAMVTQKHTLFEAAVRGGLLHAKAAEIALLEIDETSLVASDLLPTIGKSVRILKKGIDIPD